MKFYNEIKDQALGRTIRYLLVLVVLVTALLGIRYGIALSSISKAGLEWVETNVPYVEIKDGVVSAEVEQPFIVEEKDFIAVIDTTGAIQEVPAEFESGILLAKDKLLVKRDSIRTEEIDLSKIKSFMLDSKTLTKWRKILVTAIIPFMIVMLFIYFVFAKAIQALIAAAVILIFKSKLLYSKAFNVAIYALTPATLLAVLVMMIFLKPLPYFPVIYLGMYIAFVWLGLKNCTIEEEVIKT